MGRYVLVQYPDDEEPLWHERLVLARVAGRRWVTSSPDLDVGAEDLSTPPLSAIRIEGRNRELPIGTDNEELYTFEIGELSRVPNVAEIARLADEAVMVAAAEGPAGPARQPQGPPGDWRALVSAGHSHIGDLVEIPAAAVSVNGYVIYQFESNGFQETMVAARTTKTGELFLEDIRNEIGNGEGLRTLLVHFEAGTGTRRRTFASAVADMSQDELEHLSVEGPRSTL